MTKCESIILSRRPEWTKAEWNDRDYLRHIRAERYNYAFEEAPYYVESVRAKDKSREPYRADVVYFCWSIYKAKRIARKEAHEGYVAKVYDNMTDEVIN